MATPFGMTVTILLDAEKIPRYENLTFQDVADEWGVWTNTGNAFYQMPSNGRILELSTRLAGTVVFYTRLYARQLDTGIKIAFVDLINSRQPPHLMAPIPIGAGAMVQFKATAT
jgi:hypothetical protein